MKEFFALFSFRESVSAFLVLFAIIDALGAAPIIIDLRSKGKTINAIKATSSTLLMMLVFFIGGDAVLRFFSVNINSFAVAGSILLFFMAMEMLLDIEIFKYSGPTPDATVIPLVFPLLAGAGALTTVIALKADYADINILVGLLANMLWIYFVLLMTDKIQKYLGEQFIYMLRKFFGVMILAIAVGMFTSNLTAMVTTIKGV